ncbi:MAG: YafY family transcriptional regulator [Acidimicrobiia bacterium]|nr:YafY family transcriptional regulator [Acidimicrobiia bacterium]MDH5293495.1 YafY family transcriptional regulator [Acidimicrobiia bacterium]
MNRTDRLYAIVERLRADPGRPHAARKLADYFEVSVRTIERDVLALQEAGVPIYAETGRSGGYLLDVERTLPPVNFSAAEATAVAIALTATGSTPLAQAGRSALTKIMAAMSDVDSRGARELGARVVRLEGSTGSGPAPRLIEQAIVERRVVRISYEDRHGDRSRRVIEPLAVVGVGPNWYLLAWCRLRDAHRSFRMDRISDTVITRESAPEREMPEIEIEGLRIRPIFE